MTAIDLFSSRSYDDVKADVMKYLKAECSSCQGALKRGEKKGWYRPHTDSHVVIQFMLDFEADVQDEWMM